MEVTRTVFSLKIRDVRHHLPIDGGISQCKGNTTGIKLEGGHPPDIMYNGQSIVQIGIVASAGLDTPPG